MYTDTLDGFAAAARRKASWARTDPPAFFVASAMAGVYVGLGIILILSLGALVDPVWQRLVMGASFGIALTLVVFAGSELYTGLTMSMTIGVLRAGVTSRDLARVWALAWFGNLAGALLLAWLFTSAGGGIPHGDGAALLQRIAAAKMNAEAGELVARGILCNWLVCLALWIGARVQGDTAKMIAIAWCLFAFIASGYEHSVANMTLFALALAGEPGPGVSLAGAAYNLGWVTLGNTIAGVLMMASAYAFVGRERRALPVSGRGAVVPE